MLSPSFLGAAVNAASFDLTEVFETTLYVGSSPAQDIISGLDFISKDGLIWCKDRDRTNRHYLVDTLRGNTKTLRSDSNAAETTSTASITSFNDDGFSVGASNDINATGIDFVAWQFMKSKGFFDIVEYVGDGASGRTIPHDLSHEVGLLIVKSTTDTLSWLVQHKDIPATDFLVLNSTAAAAPNVIIWNDTAATSSVFSVNENGTNLPAYGYIAYMFAHNPDNGIFCGSYSGTSASGNPQVVGFPVGLLLVKATSTTSDWILVDVPRNNLDDRLLANLTNAEVLSDAFNHVTNGFEFTSAFMNVSGQEYMFMAIADPTQF